MKVAYNANRLLGHSGLETYSRELITSILNNYEDINVNLVTSFKRKEKLQKYFNGKSNLTIHNILPHDLIIGPIGRKPVSIYNKIKWNSIAEDFDLVHYTNSFDLPKLNNLIVTVHDVFPLYYDGFKKTKSFLKDLKNAVNLSKAIIVPTEEVKNDLLKHIDCDESKINVIYEAANPIFKKTDQEFDLYEEYSLPENDFFLFIGRYEKRKNVERIIEAYTKLDKNLKNDFKLVLVANESEKLLNKLRRKVKECDNENIYLLRGLPTEHLVKFYNKCTAFVFPSLLEGFGLPVIEAMQCGTPVITSNVSCLPEVAGNAAVKVNPKSIDELSRAMNKMAIDKEFREDYSKRGIERAKNFSWDKTAEKTVEIYRKYV